MYIHTCAYRVESHAVLSIQQVVREGRGRGRWGGGKSEIRRIQDPCMIESMYNQISSSSLQCI